MKSYALYLIGALALTLNTTQAELRVWTDNSGKTIEAEYVRTQDDKVILRQADGIEVKVSLDTLSERDHRYVILQTPPRLEISVSADVDRSNITGRSNYGAGMQLQEEAISAEVKIRKSSSAPYEAPLMAEVYLIGQSEKSGNYIVLDRSKSRFNFTEESEFIFESKDISLKQLEAGQQVGTKYRGYIALVRDKTGNILETKTNKLDFQKNVEVLIGSERGAVFDIHFKPVVQKRPKEEEKPKRRKPFSGRSF